MVVDDVDALDLGVIAAGGHFLGGVEHAVEGGFDIARGERRAVVELHALAELDLPRGVVDVRPGGGQVRDHATGLDVPHREVIVDVVAEDDRFAQDRVGRVPVVDVRLQTVDERLFPRLRACGRHQGEDDEQAGGERKRAAHESLLLVDRPGRRVMNSLHAGCGNSSRTGSGQSRRSRIYRIGGGRS